MCIGLHATYRYSCQMLGDLIFLDGFSKNTQISNLMKLRQVAAEMFHADGQDRQTVAFRNFAKAPKNHG